MTNDLLRRVSGHREGRAESFPSLRRHTAGLVRDATDISEVILREKRIKGWNRGWKIALIEAGNREWRNLAEEMGLGP